jgi:type I restriction enzyme M protein
MTTGTPSGPRRNVSSKRATANGARAKGTAQKKLFRDCFTETDPDAEPVIAKHGKRARAVRWADLPNQTLPDGWNINNLDPLFGVYPDKGGKKQTDQSAGKPIGTAKGRRAAVTHRDVCYEYEPDPKLKDFENIPLKEDIVSYFLREVQPYVADAWIDRKASDEQDGGIGKVGYEINFNREFFKYQPPRPLAEIDAELEAVESRIMGMLREVTE